MPPTPVQFLDRTIAPPASALFTQAPPILLGAGGMLHRAWSDILNQWQIPHRSLARRELDLSNRQSIEGALGETHTRLIINCAAYTNVDAAEHDESTATAVNGAGVGRLAGLCAARGIFLVHYSTDYVFDGRGTSPYRTGEPRRPLSAYGRSKALGEELIESSLCRHLIIRTSWLYAPWGRNFVRTIAELLKTAQKKPLRIVNDQRGRPTSSQQLAFASALLIEAGAEKVHHVTDAGDCTWFDFAREIAQHVNPAARIEPCTTADLSRPAPRPPYSVLDLEQTQRLIGPLVPWQAALADVLRHLE